MILPTPTELEGLLERASGTGSFAIPGHERPLPWEVWTSNSFRRVKTARGLDVLSGYLCKDGCVDLSMPEDRLIALVAAVNALPTLLARIKELEAVIEPFAQAADELVASDEDSEAVRDTLASRSITCRDLRDARAALTLNRSENDG